MSWRTEAGGPHHYGSETVWPGTSHGAERSAGPRGHSRYAPLSYCREGRWERMGEGREKIGTETEGRSKCKKGQMVRGKKEKEAGGTRRK